MGSTPLAAPVEGMSEKPLAPIRLTWPWAAVSTPALVTLGAARMMKPPWPPVIDAPAATLIAPCGMASWSIVTSIGAPEASVLIVVVV